MKRARALFAAACLFGCGAAHAASCSISAQSVGFGNYDPLAAPSTDANGQVTVTCSNLINLLLTYSVSLSSGTSGSYATRKMASGANRINYNLFLDPTRLIVWGDGTAGTLKVGNTYLITVLGVSANHTVYGRMPARQNVPVGAYSDTITATVEY